METKTEMTETPVRVDLAALDKVVLSALPRCRVRPGSNRTGAGSLFVYRVYEPRNGVDPVVVGVTVKPNDGGGFSVSGDIAGEMLGDILFELPIRDVMGREAMTEAARDAGDKLVQQSDRLLAALHDMSRQERPGAPTRFADGLKVAVEIAEWRKRTPLQVCGDPARVNAAYIAGIEDVLIFLRAAAYRAEKGEDYRSLSTTQ